MLSWVIDDCWFIVVHEEPCGIVAKQVFYRQFFLEEAFQVFKVQARSSSGFFCEQKDSSEPKNPVTSLGRPSGFVLRRLN